MTKGIIEILIENTGVQNAVGRNAADTKYKIYPVFAEPKEVPPYVVVWKQSNNALASLDKDEASGLDYSRCVVQIWTVNYLEGEEIFNAVRAALDKFSGTTSNGYEFGEIHLVDDSEVSGETGGVTLYGRNAVFEGEVKR